MTRDASCDPAADAALAEMESRSPRSVIARESGLSTNPVTLIRVPLPSAGVTGRPAFAAHDKAVIHPFEAVARIERTEIRDCPVHAAMPLPGFADAQPALQLSQVTKS